MSRLFIPPTHAPYTHSAGNAHFPALPTFTNRQPKVHKKQQLMTPSLRFPLLAGGTE